MLLVFATGLAADTGLRGPRNWLKIGPLLDRARSLQEQGGDHANADGDIQPVTWKRLWRELRTTQELSYVAPASILSLGLTASELLVPRLRGQCFDAVLLPDATLAALLPKLRILALLAFTGWFLNILSSILFARARWSAAMNNRVRLMGSLLRQEPAFYDRQAPGELASRLLTEPERLENLANRGPERALSALLSVVGSLALMLSLDYRLALVAIALRAPLIGKLAEAAGATVGLLGVLQQHALSAANSVASEVFSHPHSVAAHGAQEAVHDRYAERCEDYMQTIRATLVSETILRFTRLGVDSLTSLLLLGFGLLGVLRGSLTIGALTAFYSFSDTFAEGCKKLQELLHEIYTIRPACGRYFGLLDREPKMPWSTAEGASPDACHGELELVNVSIEFPGRSEAALRNVSLHVKPGETLALVGPSGAGKSTLIKLLNRLYDPDSGEVRLDGSDVRDINLHWLRRQYGYVGQNPALFDVSITDNVAFGSKEDRPEQAAVELALTASGAIDFVEKLPLGSASRVGENGNRLSGGQRQRLAVARALVRDPAVLLWDEATSALDGASERLVHAALRRRGTDRTAVLVAHRLSSVLCADRVAVVRDGRIEQVGTPDELAEAKGWFRENFYPEIPAEH